MKILRKIGCGFCALLIGMFGSVADMFNAICNLFDWLRSLMEEKENE